MKFCSSKNFRHLQEAAYEGRPDLNKRDVRGHNDHGSRFVELFEYLCVFGTRMKVDIHQALVWKYPGVCSYCVKPVCDCSYQLFRPEKASDEILKPFREIALRWNVSKFVKRDWALYPCDGTDKTRGKKWRHFLSEGMEMSLEFSKTLGGHSKALATETADLCEKIINLCGALKIDLISLWDDRYSLRSVQKRQKISAAAVEI